MTRSPHRRWKGCAMCKPFKCRGTGRAQRDPFNVERKLGSKRRANRRDIPADQAV